MAKITNIHDSKTEAVVFDDVKSWFNEYMHPSKIDLKDQKVYKHVYHEGRFGGIFQLTSSGAQKLFLKAKPRSIVDIAALTSIYRPGPLAAKVDKLWLKHKKEPFDWGHPLINETLKETRGLLVFQESVMALANKVAGFPLSETDEVRRAIMKRSIAGGDAAVTKAKELENSFVKGAVNNGVPETIAKKAYETILFMSGYGFNKSLSHDTMINTYTEDGRVPLALPISDIQPGHKLMSRDEKTGKNIFVNVLARHDHGILDLVEVELENGEKIKCTWDHKFRTIETGEMLPFHEIHRQKLSIVTSDVG